MQNLDVEEFKLFVDDNFKQRKENTKTKNKGVYQLAKHIEKFAETNRLDNLFKHPKKKDKAIIYPIMIYLDNSLDMAGVNSYLNDEFEKTVSPYNAKFKKIYPLTTINLSFFFRHYRKLKERPVLLFELISNYQKRVSTLKKEFHDSHHPMAFFNYNTSFEQYVSEKLKGDYHSKNLSAITQDLYLLEE